MSLAGTTALLSAFLDNLTTILLVAPITFLLADALDIEAVPLLIIEVIASNIGGTATLIGDPPNIIIAGATGLSFNAFIVNLAPVVVVTFAVVIPLLYLVFRSRLQVEERNRRAVMELNALASIRDSAELRRTGPVLLVTVLAFFAHQALHVEPATVALTGAAVGLLVTRIELEQALSNIEWPTLFFFVALFVMVGALEATGAIGHVADAVKDVTGGERSAELIGIAWVAALGLGRGRQHPLHHGDDPGGQGAPADRWRQRRRRLLVVARPGRLLRRQRDDDRRRCQRRRRRDGRTGRDARSASSPSSGSACR